MDAIDMLLSRASNSKLGDPAPDERSVQVAVQAALRAPDHAMLRPWRIQLISGAARERLGLVLREALLRRKPNSSVDELDKEQRKTLRAPLIIVVSARVREHPKAPAVEQILSAGAAAQNILLALHAQGYAGMWRTGAPAYDPYVRHALGLSPDDAIVAFLYIGTPTAPPPQITRPTPDGIVEHWQEPASS